MESPEKNIKNENGMSVNFQTFSKKKLEKSNFNLNNIISSSKNKLDILNTDSTIISEFMSLSLNSKIEKIKTNPDLKKIKDKNSSNTFLHYICINDENFPLIELIKPSSKEINQQNILGQTPLHISIINKNKKITKFLLENGANVDIPDNNLNTSFHLAIMNNDINNVKLLIDYKVNPFLVNKNNETPLDIATKFDYKECINLIKEAFLMNKKQTQSLNNKSEKNINLKNQINENKMNYNGKEKNNNKTINNNDIFSHKIIHYYKKRTNIMTTPKRKQYISKFNKNISFQKNNIFFTSKKPKTKTNHIQRNKSTSITNLPLNEKVYTKKIVNRSQSTTTTINETIQNKVRKYEKEKENNINNDYINLISIQDNTPRKTDFIIKNEIYLDSDNESEEEESVIRDNIINNEKKLEKIKESYTSFKTIKITPLTEMNNKANPYLQLDSFVTLKHKNSQDISQSKSKEDDLIIVEPSINTNINGKNNKNNLVNNESIQKKEKNEIKNISINKETKKNLYNFLEKIKMEEYIDILINNGFDDINLVIKQMKKGNPINDDILKEIGIERAGDRAKILIRIQECANLFNFKIPFEEVYYINRKKFEFLKYDFHVKNLQNWLKTINLQKYLGNFYNNGYYNPELIFIQDASRFPINDTIIERDLKIENINDRKLLIDSISSSSEKYILELKGKSNNEDNITNPEKEETNCIIF